VEGAGSGDVGDGVAVGAAADPGATRLPVTQIWMRPDPFSSASTASVQLSGWAKGNLRKTCTVVRPLKVPDLLAALVPRVHTIVQLPVMPCLGAAQIPALIETGLFSVAPFGSQRAKSPRELHEPMLRVTVGVAAVLVADADADSAPTERTATPAATKPKTLLLMLPPANGQSRTLNCPGLITRTR
jgi:hypothetical protein